ncbi:hypothetical protein CgunFtcFv8_007719 [Champsocephalus gunnari]|uniref:Uncharacterized protein n=1 Tax=Champsocephalus gunnari TaxID=52237 RepID=A0AAN8CHJ8_CHAGU|nr:hypothetical protein CgunFtcFv8_007719 [Champsocephalus gunnari]
MATGQHCFQKDKDEQIAAEFTRLVAADLPKSFLSGLDRHLPRLLELYKARERRDTNIHSLLESENSNQNRRSAALLGLPYFMKEDPSNFIKFCENENKSIKRGEHHYKSGHVESCTYTKGELVGSVRAAGPALQGFDSRILVT